MRARRAGGPKADRKQGEFATTRACRRRVKWCQLNPGAPLKRIVPDRCRGLTLTDVCCVLVVLVLLGHGMACLTQRTREQADRAKCSNKLRQIALAALMYANSEVRTGAFPQAIDDGIGGPPTAYTRWNAQNPFAAAAPGPNDVTAALFLLLRTQEITPDVFDCPSVQNATAWNFNGGPATS